MTALFENIIFGPIHSRRLGISLGVNLLPERAKICNFDCVYCECGSNEERRGERSQRRFALRCDVEQALRITLEGMVGEGQRPDVITFAGNGEPTLHPEFEQIIEHTIAVRDELCPEAKISVLTNATTLAREDVVRALHRVDNNITKLDSAIQHTAELINRPYAGYNVAAVVEALRNFEGDCIVQTMLLRGEVGGEPFDNTSPEEVEAWLAAIAHIAPRAVMLYSLDRDTPVSTLRRVEREEMEPIAEMVRALGIECSLS